MRRVRTIATLAAATVLSACGATQGPTPAPSATPTTAEVEARYQPPSNPCDAVSAATRRKYRLTQPQDKVFPYTGAETASGDMVMADTIQCTWAVKNPAKGQNGRSNRFTLTLDFQVPTAEDGDLVGTVARAASKHDVTPVHAAQALLDSAQADLEGETAGVTTTLERSEPVNDLGDRAYSAVLTQKNDFGTSTMVVVAFQAANAHVKVSHSGADLKIDPTLPEGLQLVTTPVPPRRLKPAAQAVARDALEALG